MRFGLFRLRFARDRLACQLFDALLQLLGRHLGLLERCPLDAMRQCQLSRQRDIVVVDLGATFEGGVRAGGFEDHQVRAMTIII